MQLFSWSLHPRNMRQEEMNERGVGRHRNLPCTASNLGLTTKGGIQMDNKDTKLFPNNCRDSRDHTGKINRVCIVLFEGFGIDAANVGPDQVRSLRPNHYSRVESLRFLKFLQL